MRLWTIDETAYAPALRLLHLPSPMTGAPGDAMVPVDLDTSPR